MTASADPKRLQARLEQVAELSLDIACRPMFGGVMVYSAGRPFVLLSDMGFAIKLSPADQARLLAEPGAQPLQLAPDQPPSRSYVLVPPQILSDDALLSDWLRRSADHVATVPAKPRRRRTR
jgi:TfoX/Sxy family transcriptional regulator of competence genes